MLFKKEKKASPEFDGINNRTKENQNNGLKELQISSFKNYKVD
jgi:hypothetical protein